MSHTIIYNSKAHVIESKFQGDLACNEVKEFISEAAQIAKENDCTFFLTDYREATLILSTVEIYEVPNSLQITFALFGLNARQLKRALVVARDLKDYQFFETVTANYGQYAKVFYDIDEARKWLFGK